MPTTRQTQEEKREDLINQAIRYCQFGDEIITSLYEDLKKAMDVETMFQLMIDNDECFVFDCLADDKTLAETFEEFIKNVRTFRIEFNDELYTLIDEAMEDEH